MNPLTLEWIQKAESDILVAEKLLRGRKLPANDAICFHAQQCAEKYLKALLQEHGKHIPKLHDLGELLNLVVSFDPACQFLLTDLETLNDYAVDFRYPGAFATRDEARAAVKAAQAVREFLRQRLGA
ncbi:MAG: HEPN domain-containing protein [Chloroflexota bacterium]